MAVRWWPWRRRQEPDGEKIGEMSWRDGRALRREARSLVDEAQAALSGQLIWRDSPEAPGDPEWIGLNTLAHASWPTLVRVADGLLRSGRREWDAALVFLASELMGAAGSPACLVSVQRVRIIPLELEVLDGARPAPSTPGELVDLIRPGLAVARSQRRHPSTGWTPGSN